MSQQPEVTTAIARTSAYMTRQLHRGAMPRPEAIAHYLDLLMRRDARRAAWAWLEATYPDLSAMAHEHATAPTGDLETTYTTAPEAYDGFGTETVAVVGTTNGKPLRQVETPTQHVLWQRQRYGSGMYPAYDPAQFADLQRYPRLFTAA